jgi:hypothetical protein
MMVAVRSTETSENYQIIRHILDASTTRSQRCEICSLRSLLPDVTLRTLENAIDISAKDVASFRISKTSKHCLLLVWLLPDYTASDPQYFPVSALRNPQTQTDVLTEQIQFIRQRLYSPLLGRGHFLSFVILCTVGRTTPSESRHTCLEWDSNPKLQSWSGETRIQCRI